MDENFTLVIDKADYWAFKMDDIERQHAHHNWESMATNRAGYRIADQMDQEILGYLSGAKQSAPHLNPDEVRVAGDKSGTDPATVDADGLLASMKLTRGDFSSNFGTAGTATHSIPLGPNPTAGTSNFASPLQVMNRANRLFDQQNVPADGRWIVVDPVFWEILQDEDSKLVSHDFVSDGESTLRNGMKTTMPVRGMRVYVSNNLPKFGSGPGTNTTTSQLTNYGYAVAGHDSAVAMAQQITKSEKSRLEGSFGDLLKGLNLYGRKILRPEALVQITYNAA